MKKNLIVSVAIALLVAVISVSIITHQQPAPSSSLRVSCIAEKGDVDTAYRAAFAVLVAREKGFFKPYNLNVALECVPSNLSAILLAGEADIALGPVANFIAPASSGADIKWVGSLFEGMPYVLLSNKPVDEIRVVGAPNAGTAPYYIARSALDLVGVQRKGLVFLSLPPLNVRFMALVAGKVDATIMFKADWLMLKAKNPQLTSNITVIADSDRQKISLSTAPNAVMTRGDFLGEHEGEVKRFLMAILYTNYWIQTHRDEALGILNKYTGNESDSKIYLDEYLDKVGNVSVEPDARTAEDIFLILQPDLHIPKFDASKFVDTSIVNELKNSGFLTRVSISS